MREHVFSRVSMSGDSFIYGLLAVLAIVGPLFFIPVRAFSVVSSKGFFAVFVVILGLVAYGVHVLRSGTLVFPRQKIFAAILFMMVASLIGSFLSPGFGHSFLGYGFETTSWLFIAVFGLIIFFSYLVINSFERIGIIYGGIVGVFIIFALTHLIRYIVGPAFANLGVLGGATATLIGSWGDLGIFFGFITLFCVTTLELAGLKSGFKWFVAILGLIAVLFLMVMNIGIVWVVLGFVSLLLSLYLFSFAYWDTQAHNYKKGHRVPWFAMALFIISIVAIFFGGFFNTLASRHQNLAWNDMRPSWGMTARVAGKSLVHNFATGYGPNNFNGTWSLAKPAALSGGESNRTDFSQGVGFVPTQMAVNGVLGIIAWGVFFICIIILLIRKTREGFANSIDRYFAIGIGISILYLSILAWVYVPGTYFLVLLALLIGSFVALFDMNSESSERVFSFIKDPRASFFGILGVTVLIVATLLLGYIELRKTISFVHYTRGLVALNQGKLQEANQQMSLAALNANHDIYRHQLAAFALSDVVQIVSKATGATKNTSSQQAEQSLGIALAHAQAATQINSMDYRNWILLGDVYRSMLNLGVSGAYDRAHDAYTEAQKRNPNDSAMLLYFAELDLVKKDVDSALGIIKDSINIYPTSNAYILRAQIQVSQQKFDAAGESLKAALALDPYNANLTYQYGLLLLSQRRYTDAVPVLQRVVLLDRSYAIAYVYLGYALEQSGDTNNANKVYDYVKAQFPGGADAITSVKSGQIDQPAPQSTTDTANTVNTKDTSKLPTKKTVAPSPKK